jgi:hypothetical protein
MTKRILAALFVFSISCLYAWAQVAQQNQLAIPINGTCVGGIQSLFPAPKNLCLLGPNSWGSCFQPNKCSPCTNPNPIVKTCKFSPVLGTGKCVKVVPPGQYFYNANALGNCVECTGSLACGQGKMYSDALTSPTGGCSAFVGPTWCAAPVNSCPSN